MSNPEISSENQQVKRVALRASEPEWVTVEVKALLRKKNSLMRKGRVKEAGEIAKKIGAHIAKQNALKLRKEGMSEEMETNAGEGEGEEIQETEAEAAPTTTTTFTGANTAAGRLQAILDRTGYSHEVTSGQRKYGGPPPNWEDQPPPPIGSEIFCGKIPKELREDELIPLFEKCGTIWDLRLMMDPATATGRGFCFVTFTDKAGAERAVKEYDGYNIRPGKRMKVNVSIPNSRLFVGNIPKNRSKDEIFQEISKITEGLNDVIIYTIPDDPKKKNRGFAFLDFDSHKSAASAKKKLGGGRVKVFTCDVIVDWADPQEEPDADTMSKVKVLYVRNLKADVTEELLREAFAKFGEIEKAKKVKDYGFVHFCERDDAVKALEALNGTIRIWLFGF